ncbi:biotin--[acetyl-CoA-carboxylase] ligase [Polaribacter batillariae]|uniref:Biotin--[acetyl-CoA-carboxylase] ligase n=1 Tax=Polaribacter batillariae TaxID=2808900 RepID=A0ABX7SUI9_9FLAO|nr:biotin--[acetyl-CoA-carboxylase] ligase [Polaribacter batillariae]QTD37163.1 biotin--[acetyl-CoA-carboxylase] ligase [Polaribacter batillariae]
MKIIKLNAIDSTNSFLKEMATNTSAENFTIVVAESQTNGRGQQDCVWLSEPFKNLTFSVYLSFRKFQIKHKKNLLFAVSLAVYEAIKEETELSISIKWPNDILSGNKKICGILIENSIQKDKIKHAVVGIGLNVNQTEFSKITSNVSSLKLLTRQNYDLDVLLKTIVSKLKIRIDQLACKEFEKLEEDYLKVLYKKNTPTMFKDRKGVLFMGLISGISKEGLLQIELEDETIKEFGIKEVSFV